VLVDTSTADDAAVYRIDDRRALVATVDFFTPIVDDPYDFGRIAAANALSDVYAMGGRPLFALNLVAFPRNLLGDGALLGEIVRGGGDVVKAAGGVVIGGHSIDDPEPKYGLAVIGEVAVDRIVRNSTAKPGDALVLTKAIGTGVISTAIKGEAADPDTIATAVDSMTTLNRGAAEAMERTGVHAATDVTGFGLIGHLRAMLRASGVTARVRASDVPLLPGAQALAAAGNIAGGTRRNLEDASPDVAWHDDVTDTTRALLCDAQTSGGLLIALPRDRVPHLLEALAESRTPAAAVIGYIHEGQPGHIDVEP
jgi:selenide,water dikinase